MGVSPLADKLHPQPEPAEPAPCSSAGPGLSAQPWHMALGNHRPAAPSAVRSEEIPEDWEGEKEDGR